MAISEKVPTTSIDSNVHFLPARSEVGQEAELARRDYAQVDARPALHHLRHVVRPDAGVDVALARPDLHLPAGDALEVGPQEHVGEEEDVAVGGDGLAGALSGLGYTLRTLDCPDLEALRVALKGAGQTAGDMIVAARSAPATS